MENSLSQNQREYVFFHLAQSLELSPEIRSACVYGDILPGKICFAKSNNSFDLKACQVYDGCPVLFPCGSDERVWTLENDGTLLFHHDLLRSAFYCLSGEQELNTVRRDSLGRFPYGNSWQAALNVTHIPVVNHYFQWIAEGISAWGDVHGCAVKTKQLFETLGFFLTHDVDRIDKYNFHLTKNQLKKGRFGDFFRYAVKWLNPLDRDNPYWTFDYFIQEEDDRGFTSTFFFLNRGKKHIDSYYRFSQPRIKKLIHKLQSAGREAGLHGTVGSAADGGEMKKNLAELEAVTREKVRGNRQHRLTYEHPLTMRLLEDSGIAYDSTLGFAAHEGFRNGYCLPFHPYDHENDRMLDIWEFPLVVMDGTLFDYRTLSYADASDSLAQILNEIRRFHGLFTLLWHNSYCDETVKPGIREFYESCLSLIASAGAQSLTGKDILEKLHAE